MQSTALRLCLCIGFLAILAYARTVQPDSLKIIAIEPAETGWPVVLAADVDSNYYQQVYNDDDDDDDDDNEDEIVFLWSFPNEQDQSCTVRGRIYTHPCRGRVVEHTWGREGIFTVTLTAYYPGGRMTTVSRTIRIENHYSGPIVARKEIRSLRLSEWLKIRHGLTVMKQKGIYDHFVYIHQLTAAYGIRQGSYRNQAHRGPAFLPWHRAFIRIFERALQTLAGDSLLGLPYWDWTVDAAMPDATKSPVWNNTYFGPSGDSDDDNIVQSGAFCSKKSDRCAGNWLIPNDLAGPYLKRELGEDSEGLPTLRQINHILSIGTYDSEPYDDTVTESRSFRNAIEGWPHSDSDLRYYGRSHNEVHDWVGGSMVPYTSPNDPVFFFHHSFIDKLYFTWQQRINCFAQCYSPRDHEPSITSRTPAVEWRHGEWRLPGHHWSDWMFPWWIRPRDVADYHNSLKGYYYA